MTYEPPEIAENRKLYVVVRGDLPRGLQMAQAGHAIAEVILAHPEFAEGWNKDPNGNYLIVLDVADQTELREVLHTISVNDIPTRAFFEPDLDNDMTAFAALPSPELNHLFSGLSLAYSKRRWVPRFRRYFGVR